MTDEQVVRLLGQSLSFTGMNPAIQREHGLLQKRVLIAAKVWFGQTVPERAFGLDEPLQSAVRELLEFEGRHGLYMEPEV